MKKIILASKSIDRIEILKRAGIPFETFITNIDEEKYKTRILNTVELVQELAKAKAIFAKNKLLNNNLDAIIIAADTIVDLDGEIIGKAHHEKEAFNILRKLMGKTHKLITGITITETKNPKIIVDSDTTIVEFLELSDEEIWDYIKTNEWKERAGAYSIKDTASLFISKINGSSSNVIGLPMHKIYEILKKEFGLNLFQIKRI
ncbi:MAG: septum formation protein Maf [Promethearchaeota archaeon]|nr:MAG: septum formation protein Maf [Candidatus Lokiarchaeota archaeon]